MEGYKENPLLKLLGKSELALEETDLKAAYMNGNYGGPNDFNDYIKELEIRGMCRNKGSVVKENAGGGYRAYGSRELLFFMDDDQLRNWYFRQVDDANNNHSRKKKTSDRKIADCMELCDRKGVRPKEAAIILKASQFAAEKAYLAWSVIPTDMFEGVFDSKKTFSDILSRIEIRLGYTVPPHVLYKKLKYFIIKGRCEKAVVNGKTYYMPKKPQNEPAPG